MKHLLLLLIALSSCSPLVPQVRSVGPDVYEYSFGIVEDSWETVFGEPLDLSAFVGPSIYFVDMWHSKIGRARGKTYLGTEPVETYVLYIDESTWEGCANLRYTLAHELLHFTCHKTGRGTLVENTTHTTPGVWINSVEGDFTVEDLIFTGAKDYCIEKWGE